jgi:hypothetical protein
MPASQRVIDMRQLKMKEEEEETFQKSSAGLHKKIYLHEITTL